VCEGISVLGFFAVEDFEEIYCTKRKFISPGLERKARSAKTKLFYNTTHLRMRTCCGIPITIGRNKENLLHQLFRSKSFTKKRTEFLFSILFCKCNRLFISCLESIAQSHDRRILFHRNRSCQASNNKHRQRHLFRLLFFHPKIRLAYPTH